VLRKRSRQRNGWLMQGDSPRLWSSRRGVALRRASFEMLEDRRLLTLAPAGSPLTLGTADQTIWFAELSPAAQDQYLSQGAYVDFTYGDGVVQAELSLSGVLSEQVALHGAEYLRLAVPGWSTGGEEGQAQLPVFRTALTIPEGVEVLAQSTVEDTRSLVTRRELAPVQPAIPEVEWGEELVPFTYDAAFYQSGGLTPEQPVWVSRPQVAGNNRTVDIEFRPFDYHPDTGHIDVATELSCVFYLVPDTTVGPAAGGSTPTDAAADLVSAAAQADYLIITADAFYDAVLPLAEWKHKMGYQTYVAKMSSIGTTDVQIYNFIKAAYDADSVKPQYVLLVGDHENVPSYAITGHPYYGSSTVWYTDYTYSCVAGSDNYADLALGRLPGDTVSQITTMVNRILAYEVTPDTGNWYDDVLLAGYYQDDGANHVEDRWFMEDIQWAADFLGGDYDFWSGTDPYNQGFTIHTKRVWASGTTSPLYYNTSSYPGRTTVPSSVSTAWIGKADEDISTVINSGVGMVLHRDHGYTGGWGDPAYNTSNVSALVNGVKTPVVFSINCETGWFDGGDYFGEAWVRNTNGGAVAYTGAVRVSYSGYNDSYFVGLMDCMYSNFDATWQSSRYANSWHVGQMLNYAKDRVFAGYGASDSYALLTTRLHTLFGDPEMQIRTVTPSALSVTHTSTLYKDSSQNFLVSVLEGGVALAGALVCLSKGNSSDFWVGTTDANGQVTFAGITAHELGDYDLVVTSRNSTPYQGQVTAVNPVLVSLPSSVSEGSGVIQGSVSLIAAATQDTVVSLQSSNSSAAAVPVSVTIPAGQTSTTFPLTVVDDAWLNGTRNVQVTASAASYGSNSVTISVVDNETATLGVALPANVTEGAGTLAGQGLLTISRAPDADVVVALASSDTSELTVPATVTLLAGHTSATFDITVVDDTLIDGAQTATVTAQVENWTSGAAATTVADNDRTLAVALSDSWEGQGTRSGAGTVTIGGTLTSDLVITLISSDTSELTLPATVTILAGATSAAFSLTIIDDALADGSQTVTVTATATAFTAATNTLVVHDNEVDHFTWDAIGTSQVDGVAFAATVRAKNIVDETILVYSSTRPLTAAGALGAVSLTPTGCPFASGVWTGNVTVNTVDTQVVLTITDGAGHSGSSNAFNVAVGAINRFAWDPIAGTRYVGVPFTATVRAVDVNGYTVSSYASTATLSANDGVADVVTGTGTGTWDYPLHTYYHDARTQVIYPASELGGAGAFKSLSLYVTTLPGQAMNTWTIRIKPTTLSSYSTYSWEGASSGWTTVYQANTTISSTGWVTFAFATPYSYNGADNLMVDFSFNNASWTSSGSVRYTSSSNIRAIYAYTDSGYGDPLAWSGTSSPTPHASTYVPNLRLSRATSLNIAPTTTGAFNAGVWTGVVVLSSASSQACLVATNAFGNTGSSNLFTLSSNQPPTVATAASITPNPVTGATAALAVLGADDQGEANLFYTWSITASPAGAILPTFSVNGTNAAKNTTATFYNDGNYGFLVTITDSGGLTTTSAVAVTVSQGSPTSIAIVGGSVVGSYGGIAAVTATLTAGGTPLSNKTVSFRLNGTMVGYAVTDGNGLATLSSISLVGLNAGTYTAYINVTFPGDGVRGGSWATADLTINKALLTASVIVGNKIYDATPAATIASRTLSGVIGSDDVILNGGVAVFADKNAGTAKTVTVTGLTLSGTAAANYAVSASVVAPANIAPATLTVTATSFSRLYGATIPPLTCVCTGFVGGETLVTSGLTGSPVLATTATAGSPVGVYPITIAAGTLASQNYAFTLAGGTLTVYVPGMSTVSPELAAGTVSAGTQSVFVKFSTAMVGAGASSNYELRSAGADGLLGTVDDPLIAVSASYAGVTATLGFAALAEDVYRLTVRDTIVDSAGNRLDGDGDLNCGGDWIQDFVVLQSGGVVPGAACLTNVGVGDVEGRGVAVQADGKIVVAGWAYMGGNIDFLVMRYNADGSLDPGFGAGGKVTTAVSSGTDYAYALAIQPDGKIVAAGYANDDFALVRYNSDGSLDPTFDGDGKVTTAVGIGGECAYAVAIGMDGKIVLAGYAFTGSVNTLAVVRYNSNGSLDSTFDGDGKVTTTVGTSSSYAYGVAIQSDGKIVAAGYASTATSGTDFALVRYNVNGSLDTTFGGAGVVTTTIATGTSSDYAYALAIQADGRIVAAGYTGGDFGLVRYNTDGSLDAAFGNSGKVNTPVGITTDYANALAIQPDGMIVAAGYAGSATNSGDFVLVRYTSSGSLDTTFGSSGTVITSIDVTSDSVRGLGLQAEGQIVAVGAVTNSSGNRIVVARYTSSGVLDTAFGTADTVTTTAGYSYEDLRSVATQADGKIVAVGSVSSGTGSDFLLIRYNPDGSLDTSFGNGGSVVTAVGSSSDYAYGVFSQSDGKILVGGYVYGIANCDFALLRYNSDGSLDTTFGAQGKIITAVGSSSDYAYSMAVGADGKIVLAGSSYNGTDYDFAVVRFNSDGSLDTTFGSAGKVTTPVGTAADCAYSVAVQADGKIVAAGYTVVGSCADIALIRYNLDGSLDLTFGGTGKIITSLSAGSDYVYGIALQLDGRIVVAGSASVGSNDLALVRYNTDGTLDATFGAAGIVTTAIGPGVDCGRAIALQPDGRIMVAGYASNGSNDDLALVRYNSDGSLDPTFDGDGKLMVALGSGNDRAFALLVGTNGQAFVVGQSYSGSNADALGMPLLLAGSCVDLASASGIPFHIDAVQRGAGQLVAGPEGVFDALGRLSVGGAAYQPDSPSYTLTDANRSVVTDSSTVAGLIVSRKVTVPGTGSEDFARTVDSFTNPTAATITTMVTIVGNLGSDAQTTVFATANGVINPATQWIGTDDADGSGTPAVIHYIHGPQGLQPTAVEVSGDNLRWTYSITVLPGQTVRLAYFTIVAPTRAQATAAAHAVVARNDFGGQAAAYLTTDELASLANFDFSSAVAGRYVFYNNSAFDGQNPAANAADDDAITPDKTPLLPGGTASFANYTSYVRGLNGVMVDIAALPDSLTAADFEFRVGNDNNPSAWPLAATPTIGIRWGAGALLPDGVTHADRVTLVWDDYAVLQNDVWVLNAGGIGQKWLQVTVKANAHTGLSQDDVFYFGNAIAESGDSATSAAVNILDFGGARDNPHNAFNRAAITDAYDFNRDQLVNIVDLALARDNGTNAFNDLNLIAVPVSQGFAAALSSGPTPPLLESEYALLVAALDGVAASATDAVPATTKTAGSRASEQGAKHRASELLALDALYARQNRWHDPLNDVDDPELVGVGGGLRRTALGVRRPGR